MANTYTNWVLEHSAFATEPWIGLTEFTAHLRRLMALDVTKAAARADVCTTLEGLGLVGFVRKNQRFPEDNAQGDRIYVFLGNPVIADHMNKVLTSCSVSTGERQDMSPSGGGQSRAAVAADTGSAAQSQLQAVQTAAYAVKVNLVALRNAVTRPPRSGVYNRDKFESEQRLIWD
jgi:hypothetical protein